MSHTTRAGCGTVFIHNGDYSGDVTVIPVNFPERVSTPDGSIKFSVDIPFADLRQLVSAYLRDRKIEQPLRLLEEDDSLHGLTCYRCAGPATRWGYVDTILDVPWCEDCWSAFLAFCGAQHPVDEGGDTDG